MFLLFFFFKHKTAYEMRISDWSSDVCSSDLIAERKGLEQHAGKFPAVQKLRKSGYDGRGVFMINSTDDLPVAFNEPSILEERVDFEKELSVLVARNQSGEVATYDVVEMEFNSDANLVEILFSPARISPEMAREAREIAIRIIEKLGLVGLLAVEIFRSEEHTS